MQLVVLAIVVVLALATGSATASIFQSGSPPDAALHGDQPGAAAGQSVAVAGDINGDGYDDIIIGAPNYAAGQNPGGVAWIFLGGPGGIATSGPGQADAQLEVEVWFAEFGTSVAGAGDVNGDGYDDVIVGARVNGTSYVFHGGPAGISSAAIPATILFAGGFSVAGAGDVNGDGYDDVIIGTPGVNLGQVNEGAAVIFHGSPTGIVPTAPLDAPTLIQSNVVGAELGTSVAGAGDINGDGYDDVIVGSPGGEGRASVFLGSPTGVASGTHATAHARIRSQQDGAHLGQSVAGAGDVNGDGYDDVIVGAPYYNDPLVQQGLAVIFLGSASGLTGGSQNPIPANPAAAASRLVSELELSQFGWSVAGAGDVNDDGYDDVIIGARHYKGGPGPPSVEWGGAFVYLGGPSGIASEPESLADASLQVDETFTRFGYSVAGAGDLNGDGSDDVIVGAPQDDSAGSSSGAAFVYLGNLHLTQVAVPGLTPVGIALLVLLLVAIPVWLHRRPIPTS